MTDSNSDSTQPSLRERARAAGLPSSTQFYREQGRLPPKKAHASQQLITPEQEEVLVDHLNLLADLG